MPDLDPAAITRPAHPQPDVTGSPARPQDGHQGAIPSDVALMARLREQDADALAMLYDRHASAVYGLARSILRDGRLAEEATHDIFLHLWQQPHLYEPSRGSFAGWLLRVARNRAIDLLRRDRERPFAGSPQMDDGTIIDPTDRLIDPDPGPAEQAERVLLQEGVQRALAQIDPDQRRLLELAYYGGLTQREIAARLNRPLGTVKTQIRNAMRRLAQVIETAGLDAQPEREHARVGDRSAR